jgi:alkylation response protein AidB-like acyl-CoA dehydrogenase
MASDQTLAQRGMAIGLRTLNLVASSSTIDRLRLREPALRLLHCGSVATGRAAASAGRTFAATQRLSRPARQPRGDHSDLFDLEPTEEQRMLRDSVREFALAELRSAASSADQRRAVPAELLAAGNELGLATVGVPDQLGGAVHERSATTAVLMSEALAQGDLGIAVACLAPAAVATALSLWGDAEQQATYLPPFVGDDGPAAALAVMEPQPLFDPFVLRTTARRANGGFRLDGVKALVPRAADAELFVIAADLEGEGPALFIVESKWAGTAVESDPAMGIRAAATGRVIFEDVRLPATALLAGGERSVYRDCIALARLAWCALAVGTGQAVLDYVSGYVKDRRAFGEPISNRQAVAFAVANIAIELDGLRLITYRAAARVDRGLEFSREVSLARRLCAERGMTIGSDGVQLLGGHGYVTEHPVERWYRDLRAAGLMEGALLV